MKEKQWRNSNQFLMPSGKPQNKPGDYNPYPSHQLGEGQIHSGFESLAAELQKHKCLIIDGNIGVFFDDFKQRLQIFFSQQNLKVTWINMADALKPENEINKLIAPFSGGDDPLFGKRINLNLTDFFNHDRLNNIKPSPDSELTVIYGVGAALSNVSGYLVYVDLPRNELQFRARAKAVTNLGATRPDEIKPMYKRFYFIDWPVLDRHKQDLLPDIDIIADSQRPDDITWMKGDDLRQALYETSHSVFRVRPWFEPGAWGGKWIQQHIGNLSPDVPNYAWSFELIVPENGLVFESSGLLLEVSFSWLMFQEGKAVLGVAADRFGIEFPIRFDFLDTFGGGNLSVQCHPQVEYIQKHFNENFTQEETYYILDSGENAVVYLGFQDNIQPEEFKKALINSYENKTEVDIERYVQKLPSEKHDLFLIPPGTIHASGTGNLVLEISSTPYIYTFKMYDWLRLDLDGKPRPLNFQRGMENLCFNRKGKYVTDKLVSKPVLLESCADWQLYHLPTHERHLYDVHRMHIKTQMEVQTENKCHVLSLVEGAYLTLETGNGKIQSFNYAETFVVPAAAKSYKIINNTEKEIWIIKAFVK